MNKTNPKKSRDPLVGRFFHSVELNKNTDGPPKREIGWQGIVVSKRLRGHYLVQLFEWLTGGPSDQLLVHRDDMADWKFYDSAAETRLLRGSYVQSPWLRPSMTPISETSAELSAGFYLEGFGVEPKKCSSRVFLSRSDP